MNFPGGPDNFEQMQASKAAAHQKLIIGPWPHWVNRMRTLSEVDFGEHAIIELDDYVTRFFDRYLKGKANGIEGEKPVHVFVTGANQWWAEDSWPVPGTEHVPFYFHSRGHANSLRGDGASRRKRRATSQPTGTATTRPARPGSCGTCARGQWTTGWPRSATTACATRARC